jgi:ATP-dependent DNA helicase RecG
MVDPAIQHHLDQLGKPLQYAMRHHFAHLAKLRALEPYIQHQISALQSQPLAEALPPLLRELAQTVRGFDALDLPQKQSRLLHMQEVLTRLQTAAAAPAAPRQPAVIDPPSTAPPPPPRLNDGAHVSADALTQPVQYVRGVGPKRAALLAKLNLQTVTDLLWCLPIRYEDRRRLTPLGLLRIGQRQTFYGVVRAAQSVPQRRGKPIFMLSLEDDSGALFG